MSEPSTVPTATAPTATTSVPAGTSTPRRTLRREARARDSTAQDEVKVRRASLSVGIAVAIASGSIVLIGCIVLIILSFTNAVHISGGPPEAMLDQWGRLVITPPKPRMGWLNADQFIWAVAALAIVSLILTPIVAWVMARRAVKPLAEALRLQRHFVADASHELRTPLTALSSRVQVLQRRIDSGKPVGDLASQLHKDTTNMARILDDMLLTVEGASLASQTRSSVLTSMQQAVTSLGPLADQSSITLTLVGTTDIMVAVPDTSLTRAIVAIVDNAIQHSPAGGTVEVSAEQVGSTAIIRVRDQGSGIQGVNPQRVFERFSHGSETGRKRSFGLGLALTSEVAHRFGGDIKVESTSSHGTTFALTFPRA